MIPLKLGLNVTRCGLYGPKYTVKRLFPVISLVTKQPLPNKMKPIIGSTPLIPIGFPQIKKFNTHMWLSKRQFHQSSRINIQFPPNNSNFRIYRFSPIILICMFIGCLFLFILMLPIIFSVFFPLIIGGIIIYQFKRWKMSRMFNEMYRALQRTELKISSRTLAELQNRYLKTISNGTGVEINEILNRFYKVMNMETPKIWNDPISQQRAERFLTFLNARVRESIDHNEHGIRSYFMGDNSSVWINEGYHLKIDTAHNKIVGQNINGDLILSISYKLILASTNEYQYLADVSVVILDDVLKKTGKFMVLNDMAEQDIKSPMIIAIRSINTLLPKSFIITDIGESGKPPNYTVHTTKSGNKEFTYHD